MKNVGAQGREHKFRQGPLHWLALIFPASKTSEIRCLRPILCSARSLGEIHIKHKWDLAMTLLENVHL